MNQGQLTAIKLGMEVAEEAASHLGYALDIQDWIAYFAKRQETLSTMATKRQIGLNAMRQGEDYADAIARSCNVTLDGVDWMEYHVLKYGASSAKSAVDDAVERLKTELRNFPT
jgi:hypothetical protein